MRPLYSGGSRTAWPRVLRATFSIQRRLQRVARRATPAVRIVGGSCVLRPSFALGSIRLMPDGAERALQMAGGSLLRRLPA